MYRQRRLIGDPKCFRWRERTGRGKLENVEHSGIRRGWPIWSQGRTLSRRDPQKTNDPEQGANLSAPDTVPRRGGSRGRPSRLNAVMREVLILREAPLRGTPLNLACYRCFFVDSLATITEYALYRPQLCTRLNQMSFDIFARGRADSGINRL